MAVYSVSLPLVCNSDFGIALVSVFSQTEHVPVSSPSSLQVAGFVVDQVVTLCALRSSLTSFSGQDGSVQVCQCSVSSLSQVVEGICVCGSSGSGVSIGGSPGCPSSSPSANAVGSREHTITIAMNSDSSLRFVVFMFIPSFLTSAGPFAPRVRRALARLGILSLQHDTRTL